ncbi:hypothetical protein HYU23_00170 [Candidatus Woesearchaeota archaeon]|nr:hypothetical protein [Candidatus Woesearchaeota archaeon]
MQELIKYSGLKDLNEDEQVRLKNLVEKEFPKIQRLAKEISSFNINIKVMKKETKKRYMINMKLQSNGKIFVTKNKDTERGGDWDLNKEVHKELKALIGELKHHYKNNVGRWKLGGIKGLLKKFES